ncbi:MAG: FecR domain-containing protein [Phycisphaerales bacterium JB063]
MNDAAASPSDRETDLLIAAYLDGSISDAQYDTLCDRLRARPALLERLASLSQLDRMLVDEMTHADRVELIRVEPGDGAGERSQSDSPRAVLAQLAAMEAEAGEIELVDLTDRVKRERLARRRAAARGRGMGPMAGHAEPGTLRVWATLGGLAAAVALVAAFVWPGLPQSTTQPGPVAQPGREQVVFASVLDDFQPAWEAGASPRDGSLGVGRYRLAEGSVRMRLADGTRVKVVGPADFSLEGVGSITLTHGRLVADVPEGASGFRVQTPAGDIIDEGTAFGVDVLDHKTTEAEVISGRIRVAPRSVGGVLGEFVEVGRDRAVRMDRVAGRIESIQSGGDRFSMDYVRVLDLVDAVAGGDGTTGRRNAGIDPQNGRWQDAPMGGEWGRVGDDRFHTVPYCPLIAGTFIPRIQGEATQLDPAGHTFNGLTVGDRYGYGQTWAGGYVPVPGEQPELDTIIEGVNYAAPSRGLIRMHANSGLCFDLGEMRRLHPGLTTTRFRAGLSNREATRREAGTESIYASVDVWVFVDGELRYSRSDVTTSDGLLDIDLPLSGGDRYLTVVITDALNTNTFDWVLLCQPRIDLRPSDRP